MADEDLHAVGAHALVEQVQYVALLVERIEQALQLLDVGELGEAHQIRLAGDHDVGGHLAVGTLAEHLLRHADGIEHQLVHVAAGFLQLRQQLLAHVTELAAAELLVEEVRRAAQLLRLESALELQDPVLHLAAVDDQDREHPLVRQPEELDLRDRRVRLARDRHDAGELREAREELRGGADQRARVVRVRAEALLEHVEDAEVDAARGAHLEQRVDEEAIALVGRHAPGGGVRGADEAELLEVGHDVAHGRGGELQPRLARQRARADRLAVADVGLDERRQQPAGAFRERAARRRFSGAGSAFQVIGHAQ